MSGLDSLGLSLLAAWGALVGLDLASWPQFMLSRPIVAGAIAGLLLDDPMAGLGVGAVLELFALDVLPIGATQYPDLGIATLAGVVLAAGRPLPMILGPAVGLALGIALASGPLIEAVRRANAKAARQSAADLAAGDPLTVGRLHLGGLRRDLLRSAALSALAIAAALLLRPLGAPEPSLALPLMLVVVAGATAASVHGAIRSTSQGGRLGWVAAGLAGGILVLLWR